MKFIPMLMILMAYNAFANVEIPSAAETRQAEKVEAKNQHWLRIQDVWMDIKDHIDNATKIVRHYTVVRIETNSDLLSIDDAYKIIARLRKLGYTVNTSPELHALQVEISW